MIRRRDTALAFGALPEIGALLLSAEPAFVVARDGSRVLWVNPAGGARLGAADFRPCRAPAGPRRSCGGTSPAWRARCPRGGRWRGSAHRRASGAPDALPLPPVRAGEERGVLVDMLEGARESADASPTLAGVLLPQPVGRRNHRCEGRRAGGGRAGRRGGRDGLPPPRLSFPMPGGTLRLYIVERWQEAMPPPAPEFGVAIPSLDGPGLSAIAAGIRPAPPAAIVPEPTCEPDMPEPAPQPSAPEPTAPEPPPAAPAAAAPPEEAPAAQRLIVEKPAAPSVMAGRVPRNLSRKPVRFLWQTDAADRFLFLSPGLSQVVGRNAEVVGERWQDASVRLRLDPNGRIADALRRRDTWSGLTAWWPVEGSNVRVPVELTALPVFDAGQSFQGYRGFGILRPAEALMPATFEERFGEGRTGAAISGRLTRRVARRQRGSDPRRYRAHGRQCAADERGAERL